MKTTKLHPKAFGFVSIGTATWHDMFGRFSLRGERRRVSPHYERAKWGTLWYLYDHHLKRAVGPRYMGSFTRDLHASHGSLESALKALARYMESVEFHGGEPPRPSVEPFCCMSRPDLAAEILEGKR